MLNWRWYITARRMIEWKNKTLGRADGGKLTDSQDSFKFSYVDIDPRRRNFSISATFEVEDASGADFQSGYGIMVVDTIESPSDSSRHRNSLMVGRFRPASGCPFSYGVRVVGGYSDRDAMPQDRHRMLDPSRLFSVQDPEGSIVAGIKCSFTLEKTDEGFRATVHADGKEDTICFPGCDFLLRQDRRAIYVGFAVAGAIKVDIKDVSFETSPGRISHTPKDAIKHRVPDYPFQRSAIPFQGGSSDGDPFDLSSAIREATPGSEIILPDGIYKGGPYYIPEYQSGKVGKPIILRAKNPGRAIIDGSSSKMSLPGFILRGNHWILDGLVFRNSLSSGLFVCGSDNEVRNCEAYCNRDTGILICSFPGSAKKDWPARNRIEYCQSRDNCDLVRCNADGFGAKLSIGKGNGFYSCKAFHNIDDGFDLYTKSTIGPIGAVTLEKCEAYSNGWLSGEARPTGDQKTGRGFKLGGEYQRVRHKVRACVAHDNVCVGFDSNSNEAVVLKDCEAWGNGSDFKLPDNKLGFLRRWRKRIRIGLLSIFR